MQKLIQLCYSLVFIYRILLISGNNAMDERTNFANIEPMEHILVSSENESNPSEYSDDGYEKPYTTLVETNRITDEHVYLITDIQPGNGESVTFDNAGCELALTCTEKNLSLDKRKSNENVNNDLNDHKLKTVENYLYDVECDIQTKI